MRATVADWVWAHLVELTFALLVLGTLAYILRITSDSYLWGDHWLLVDQAASLSGLFEPYNGHLSVIPLSIYRVLTELFGFTHLPFQVVSTLSLLGVSVAYFLATRRRFGAPLAGLLGLSLLFADGMYLYPPALNHYVAMIGAIACAALIDRRNGSNVLLAAALTFTLLSAAYGVAVLAACLVHSACVRPPLRRWAAVAAPGALWGLWYLAVGGSSSARHTGEGLGFAWGLVLDIFADLGLGSRVLGAVLLVAFAAFVVWQMRGGIEPAANALGWSIGLAVCVVGLTVSRSGFDEQDPFRYHLVGLVFVLLALVPREPIRWPARFTAAEGRRRAALAACLLLVIGGARGLLVRSDLQDSALQEARFGNVARAEVLELGLGPGLVADNTILPMSMGFLRAGEARKLLDRFGQPFPATTATADRQLVDMGIVRVTPSGSRSQMTAALCQPMTEPMVHTSTYLFLWSPDPDWTVEVRRFGQDWVEVGRGRPGRALHVTLPTLNSDGSWLVRANGACRVGPPG